MNVSVLEEWVGKMGLPRGVQSHFAPVRDLLNWLQVGNHRHDFINLRFHLTIISSYQCLSSINDFSNLIATVQTMRNLNPLQVIPVPLAIVKILTIRSRCAAPFEITNMK